MRTFTTFTGFSGVEDLRQKAEIVDRAEIVPLFYQDAHTGLTQVESTKGVRNVDQGYLMGTVSKDYVLLQNREMITSLADAFEETGINPVGQICNDHHKVSVEVHFPSLPAADLKQANKPVFLGAKFMNSYNKSTSFKGFGFLHRTICSNGAYARSILGDLQFAQSHTGDLLEQAPQLVENYVDRLDTVTTTVSEILGKAAEYQVFFSDPEQIVRSLGAWAESKRAGKAIYQHLTKEVPVDQMEISKYDLWNAFTSFVSHEAKMNESVRDRISLVAERVLNPKVELAPVEEIAIPAI